MTLTHKLDSVQPLTHQLVQEGNVFKVSGADPQLVYDVASIQVSGKHSGLLRFDFHCAQRKEDPRLQVYWWGDSVKRSGRRSTASSSPPTTAL